MVELDHCANIDFSPLLPDNPQSPECMKGYGWSEDCLKPNPCPDYCHADGITLEELKKELGMAKLAE